MKRLIIIVIALLGLSGCADYPKPGGGDAVKAGRDLFHGCDVDVRASQSANAIQCEPGSEFNPFAGNGRSCGSCHRAQDKFGMSKKTRDTLAKDDPFFYPDLDEDLELLTEHGLVHVIGDGLNEFRQAPSLNELCTLCDKYGTCESMGLNSDRVKNLQAFTIGAVINHHAISVERVANEDFILPSMKDRQALVDYMLSSDVCKGL